MAESYGKWAGYGEDATARALTDSLICWADVDLHGSIGFSFAYPQILEDFMLLNEDANEKLIEKGLREASRHFEALETGYLSNSRYVTGNSLSIADSYIASIIMQAEGCGFDLDMWPKVSAWLKRVKMQEHWSKVHKFHYTLIREFKKD